MVFFTDIIKYSNNCLIIKQETFAVIVNAFCWTQVFDSRIQDASVVKYVFYPETSYSGRIELYKSNWPDEGWTVTDLHYRVGETAHMNIFTGKEHDGKTRIYIECDIHKLTKTEMVWYKTDSKEEMARFKKDSKIDNN